MDTLLKILIQDCKTEMFLRVDSSWALELEQAFSFLSAKQALYFGLKELKDSFRVVEVVTDDCLGSPLSCHCRSSREYVPELLHSYFQDPDPTPRNTAVRGRHPGMIGQPTEDTRPAARPFLYSVPENHLRNGHQQVAVVEDRVNSRIDQDGT